MGAMGMMAKKKSLAVLVAMAAMTAGTAVPAFAQEDGEMSSVPPVGPAEGGQYAPMGETPQEALPAFPVAGSGQYAPAAEAAQGAAEEGSGQGGEDCIQLTYPATPCLPEAEGSGQYAPGTPVSSSDGGDSAEAEEAFAGVGVVESLGGDGRYGLRLGPLEGQELSGDFDFAGFEGETVRVSGRFAIDETRGRVLQVESIELTQEKGEDCILTTYPEQPCPPQEVGVPVDATMPEEAGAVVSGDTSNDKGGVSMEAGGSGSVVASGGAGQGGGASPIAKVLPATGGGVPIAGLAGLVILAGGLLFRRISR